MLSTGLVSVTFRKLTPAEVIALVARAQLDGIEWGGDIHVPPGDLAHARAIRQQTQDAGLRVLAYGSYFRLRPQDEFEPVLATAIELGAPLVRVWAGDRGSAQVDAASRQFIEAESQRIAELAARENIRVAYEFHDNTLTDTLESTQQLLHAAPAMQTLWQPPHQIDETAQLAGLQALMPRLANVHVFHWQGPTHTRLPLSEGREVWRPRLALVNQDARNLVARPHAALLEFVTDDDPAAFLRDAATFKAWLAELANDATSPSSTSTST